MKCGNCKSNHDTVADVRACYAGALQLVPRPLDCPTSTEPVWSDRTPRGARTPVPASLTAVATIKSGDQPATEKQINFLNKLLDERPEFRSVENLHVEVVEKMGKREISKWIEKALDKPKETKSSKSSDGLNEILKDVEDCYVALPSKSGNNDLDFIRIGTNQGKMDASRKGWRRVQRIIGGHAPISMRIGEAVTYAKIIAAMSLTDLKAAQVLFGREIGQCGVCGRSLTDEESRAQGIGPVCREGF